MKAHPGKYQLPHLAFTLIVKTQSDKKPLLMNKSQVRAYVSFDNSHQATIHCHRSVSVFTMAHELMHVIQHICRTYFIDWENETEHTAYIMQYFLGLIFGYVYDTRK